MTLKKDSSEKIIYLLFAIFYFWLASQIPYTHDDWDWGLDIGIQQWLTASVNSRYIGNFFEIIMTRSQFLKTVIMGSCFFGIPYLLSNIVTDETSDRNKFGLLCFLAANFLLLTMPRVIWSETYGWVAGFANFGISAIFVLLNIRLWLPLLEQNYTPEGISTAKCMAVFIMTICGQLFLENIALLIAAVSVVACIVAFIRSKKIPQHYIIMAVAAVLGLVVIFSSTIYSSLLQTGEAVDGYRQLIIATDEGIAAKLFKFFIQCGRLAVRAGQTNTILCLTVLFLITCKVKEAANTVGNIFKLINFMLAVYFAAVFVFRIDFSADSPIMAALGAAVNGLYFLLVPVELYFLYRDHCAKGRKLMTVWVLALGVIAPLIVTTESGYRLIFSMNVVLILFVLILLKDLTENIAVESFSKLRKISLIAVIVPALVLIYVYIGIGSCTDTRLALIAGANETNTSSIVLPQYPYRQYLHAPDPIDENRWIFFREFYEIAPSITVSIEGQN